MEKYENDILLTLKSIDESLKNISKNLDYKKAQKEGIERAKKQGKQIGRTKKEKPKNYEKYKELILKHKISIRQAAQEMNVNHATLASWIKQEKEE